MSNINVFMMAGASVNNYPYCRQPSISTNETTKERVHNVVQSDQQKKYSRYISRNRNISWKHSQYCAHRFEHAIRITRITHYG
jgi:hypothetical protein